MRLPSTCWGWIWTVPVLTIATDLMRPVEVEPDRGTAGTPPATPVVMILSCPGRALAGRPAAS
jgi:hypothetical protein